MKTFGVWVSLLALSLFFAVPALAVGPEIDVTTPKDGGTIQGGLVVVQYDVKNFKIVDFTKDPSVSETQGHMHIQLDENPYNTIHTISNVWVFAGVKPGKHRIELQLVHSDHSPLKSKVEKVVEFTVAAK